MKHLSSCMRTTVGLAVLLAVIAATVVQSYSVRYAGKVSASGIMNFESLGYCAQGDSGHSMMPKLESYQVAAAEVLAINQFSKAPIGGEARQAACLDANCTWQFNHGLHFHNELTFFYGVVYKGELRGHGDESTYNNFSSDQPIWWGNVSYWGGRQPYMKGDHGWANENVVTFYHQWVCEYYEYQRSDADIFPTYPDGDVIVPQSDEGTYYHCGRLVEVDSQGRWIYQRCKEPFPWWGALIITVMLFIALIAAIIAICCGCFYFEREKVRREQEHKLETLADNPAQVPTQTQLGLGSARGNSTDGQ
ncbi:hypothetical protein JKF63_05908 [Porcisia hertigi]|uniref:Uncharacterized protein n=1 Tax=Porcisia hertigi TaxID=2761500 RepID=A0A836LFI6_9TRYP|nr:hypothetical protein JKF63_05908 [Porcisia hertigi]